MGSAASHFFINDDKTKYVSVGYYPHAIISPWWNSVPFGGTGPSASFSPTNRWLLWRTVCLLYVTLCVSAGTVSSSSARVATFGYTTPRRHGSARLFVGTEYISLTLPDMNYLVRVFHIIQQQLRHYISAMPDVLSYVTSSLASSTFVESPPNASTFINYPRLYEELVTFV